MRSFARSKRRSSSGSWLTRPSSYSAKDSAWRRRHRTPGSRDDADVRRTPLALLALLASSGCSRPEKLRVMPDPTPAPAPAAIAEPTSIPALDGAPLERLELGSGHFAYVAVPVGARERRAILVGVHGAGDRADWSCTEWQTVTAGWAFVVCPEGTAHAKYPGTFVWGSAAAIAEQADRAVRAVRARYAAWVDDAPLVYGGWSQGATLAGDVIGSRPGVYDRVALVEIGHTPVDASKMVDTFSRAGVRRAVVSCSSIPCRTFSREFERSARRRGLSAGFNDVGLRGHWFDEPVFRTLGPKVAWMVDDAPRFAGLVAAIDARYSTD